MRSFRSGEKAGYRPAGGAWRHLQRGYETSAWHHNAFGGFLSLRLGLCVTGTGEVAFRNFRYRPIEQ